MTLPAACPSIPKGILARTLTDYSNIASKMSQNRPLLQRWKAATFSAHRSAAHVPPAADQLQRRTAVQNLSSLHMSSDACFSFQLSL